MKFSSDCGCVAVFSLSNLETLELRDNVLKYLPVSISMLQKLKLLDLGSNAFDELVSQSVVFELLVINRRPKSRHLIHSFIPAIFIAPLQVHYYSEALPPQHEHCQSFTPKCHRQLRVKDLPKVPTWRREWDSNLRPFG